MLVEQDHDTWLYLGLVNELVKELQAAHPDRQLGTLGFVRMKPIKCAPPLLRAAAPALL